MGRRIISINDFPPEIVVSQLWLRDDESNEIDIIELNTSNSPEMTMEDITEYSFDNVVYDTSHLREPENQNYINEKARELRRRTTAHWDNFTYQHTPESIYNNQFASNSAVFATHKNSNISNHPINCFTIVKKHFITSDSSSEQDFSNVELPTQIGDVVIEHSGNSAYEKLIESDTHEEKRTIWIYSHENKHLLSENDQNLMSTSYEDTDSSTCSNEKCSEEKYESKSINKRRVASPIPPLYIPRLDLSAGQTLSTVTEASETYRHPTPVKTERSIKIDMKQKPINNWLTDKNAESITRNSVAVKNDSLVTMNWLALSPRDEKRKCNTNNAFISGLEDIQESPRVKSKFTNFRNQKDIEIFTDPLAQTVDPVDITKTTENNLTNLLPTTMRCEPKNNVRDADGRLHFKEINKEEHGMFKGEDGIETHKIRSRKPQIRHGKKHVTHASKVTSPIEKLDSNNWIINEGVEQSIYKFKMEPPLKETQENIKVKLSKNDRLWSKHVKSLMKPAQWDAYEPITETPLYISLSLDDNLGKRKWLSRLMDCFRCFKIYK